MTVVMIIGREEDVNPLETDDLDDKFHRYLFIIHTLLSSLVKTCKH